MKARTPAAPPEAVSAARAAGLHYVADTQPGIRRERRGGKFCYRGPRGRLLCDPAEVARLRRLAIPPAWNSVWICPDPAGHIQATGRDARRRKQYRYHPGWRLMRDETKFERMLAFGRALPRIRRRVTNDLRRRDGDRRKVLAAMVRLLEITHIRIGNEEYARTNHSFGLTTLRDRHARVQGQRIRLGFAGKSGRRHEFELHDSNLARIVRQSQDLPGEALFQWVDATKGPQKICSEDLNRYLRETAGEEFSAKDFRTWAGSLLAADALRELSGAGHRPTQRQVAEAVKQVATALGNTPAICRKCYIHPFVIAAYLAGEISAAQRARPRSSTIRNTLSPKEAALIRLLRHRGGHDRAGLESSLRQSLQSPPRRKRRKSNSHPSHRG